MSEEDKKYEMSLIAEYKGFVDYSQKNYNPVIQDATSSGYFDSELKARMDIITLKNLFYTEDWVYILIDRICSKIASLPLRIAKETVNESGDTLHEYVPKHPLQKLLDRPNDKESYYQFMYSVVADYCATGNTIIYNAKNAKQMIKIPTEYVQLHFGRDEDLEAYLIYASDRESGLAKINARLAVDEVIHIRRPNPSSMYWGLSPLVAGSRSVLFNRYSSEYLLNFYVKGAQPGYVFELGDQTNEKVALRMLRSIELANTGRANQRRNLVAPKGVKVSTLEHRIADQDLKNHVLGNRETIINIFQVPKHELSIAEAGSLGSEEYKIAIRNFWDGPLKAIMESIEWGLWQAFSKEIGDGYAIKFDTSHVQAIRDDEMKKADLAAKMKETHTVNEIRAIVYGDEPIEGGDTLGPAQPAFPSFGQFSTAPSQVKEVAEEVVIEDKEIDSKQEERKAILETNALALDKLKEQNPSWISRREELEGKIDAETSPQVLELVLNTLEKQAVAAIGAVKKGTVFKSLIMNRKEGEIPSKTRLRKMIGDALNKFEDEWLNEYTQILKTSVDLGYDVALTVPFNIPDESSIIASRARGENGRLEILEARGLETFAQMSRTTTEKIMREVTLGLASNLTIQDIAANISQVMADEDFTLGRAMTIARTETLTASSIGQAAAMQDAAKEIKNLKKVWLNGGDNRVRGNPGGLYPNSKADHWSIHAEVVDHDKNFSNGLAFPRDPSGPAHETINCRCTFIWVPEEEATGFGLGEIPQR